jgi:hypothetical protein
MTATEALELLMLADVAEDKATVLRHAADEILHPGHLPSEECARQVREASNGLLRLADLLREQASMQVSA